jgi:hypothetical protein
MHRPGIARIQGATITLNGTTIEEVERYHRDTLQLAVAETNKQYASGNVSKTSAVHGKKPFVKSTESVSRTHPSVLSSTERL